jgi:succinyl-diaminopimelate desuccinylase
MVNSKPFLTEPGPFTDLLLGAIEGVTGRKAELSTTGGTSDARFVKDYCPVAEFGLIGQTMHKVDERARVEDIQALAGIYRHVLDRFFATWKQA